MSDLGKTLIDRTVQEVQEILWRMCIAALYRRLSTYINLYLHKIFPTHMKFMDITNAKHLQYVVRKLKLPFCCINCEHRRERGCSHEGTCELDLFFNTCMSVW
jgi:hypothetical protein